VRAVIDLHTHSSVSDGSEPPERIPQLAAAAGCSAVALTDHDNLAGLPAAAVSAQRVGVELVPGCEVSCSASAAGPAAAGARGSMHVLVYFVDDPTSPLGRELEQLRADRAQRNDRLLARLAELEMPLERARVVALAGTEEGVGRPHVARAMVEAGYVADVSEAFDTWLADGRPAYVPKARLAPADVARLARDSGGVAVLAHPLSLELEPAALEQLIGDLADAGFAGIEATYGAYPEQDRARLVRLAREAGLVATGGSDFHGTFKPDLAVGTGHGDLQVPDAVLEELADRRP